MPTLDRTINNFNIIMERNNSAYRWVSGVVTRITDETEINTIDVAIQQNQYSGVRKHLQTALELLSNKTSPDYRNSAKESISAVESLCVQLCGADYCDDFHRRAAAPHCGAGSVPAF